MDFLNELNDEQRRAVEAGDGPVLIVAGPGTGKTKTLTARIGYLVASGKAKPNQVLALTFTKKAAEEMQKRISNHIFPHSKDKPWKGGKDGVVGFPYVSTFHGLCYELLDSKLVFVDEIQRLQIIKKLSRPVALKHLSTRELGLLVSRAKNMADDDAAVAKVVGEYNTALAEKDLLDFDDLLLRTRDLLQNNAEKRGEVQARWHHILVDEFQDTNRLQYELLQLLRGHDNLFVIGDPNQSIYGFRGASGDIFNQFKADFPKSRVVALGTNYRSVSEVVRLSNAIFPDDADLSAYQTASGQVRAVQVLNEYSEANWVLGEIQQAIGGGDLLKAVSNDDRAQHRRLSDFAVLYRSRAAALALQRVIAQSGLPFQVVGEGSPYDQGAVQSLLHLLRTCHTGNDAEIKGFSKMQCRVLLKKIDTALAPSEVAQQLIAAFGFEPSRELSQVLGVLVRFNDLPSALNYFDALAEQNFYDPRADAITLLTIHASKGLEFPRAFLIAAEEGILPHHQKSGDQASDREEERRLFYVAATRAREQLDIAHAKFRGGKPAEPSSFVTDIADNILPKTTDPSLATDHRRAEKRRQKRAQGTLF